MSETHEVHALYLRDLGCLLKQMAIEAKRTLEAAAGDQRTFDSGRLTAFYEVVSLMQQQATAFDLPLVELCLDDVDPDRDLL